MNIFLLSKYNFNFSNISNNNSYINFLLSKNNLLNYLKSINYFQIFNFFQNYHIDKDKLKTLYKMLQFHFHPDKYKKRHALECSSIINIAYKTLMDDISRIKYILKLNNIKGKENCNEKINLLELFKIQEKIDNSSQEMLKKIKIDTLNKIKIYKEDINKEYDKKNFFKIKEIIDNINYNNSILNHINKINQKI